MLRAQQRPTTRSSSPRRQLTSTDRIDRTFAVSAPLLSRSLVSYDIMNYKYLFGVLLAVNLIDKCDSFFGRKSDCEPPCVRGDESIMSQKEHGTSHTPVQNNLRWNCDVDLADRICNFNRHYAEHSGYFLSTSFQAEASETPAGKTITFYDSNTGKPLFEAPIGRTMEDFLEESRDHGWPSFRDAEVKWENVRVLGNGETVSLAGTHLGHNLPDHIGNRYCINLVSVAGNPEECVN